LGVFENRVLRKIFGPKRDEVAGALGNQIRIIWVGRWETKYVLFG